jgi:hypothetical protein
MMFFTVWETDLNKDFIIPPSKPTGEAYTDVLNSMADTVLKLHEAYVASTVQVAPLYDVSVEEYLLYLAGLTGQPQPPITAPGASIQTNEEGAVDNLLNFLSNYTA